MLPDEAPGIEDAYSEDGVDLTLIRWMLSLTPAERLQAAQEFANFVLSARARTNSISQPAADAEQTRG